MSRRNKVVYIAGAYRAESPYLVGRNIARAAEFAQEVWKMGATALSPQLNSAHFDGCATGDDFVEGTLELMRRSDAVLVIPNYSESKGTLGEISEARRLNKPVFYNLKELEEWLTQIDD